MTNDVRIPVAHILSARLFQEGIKDCAERNSVVTLAMQDHTCNLDVVVNLQVRKAPPVHELLTSMNSRRRLCLSQLIRREIKMPLKPCFFFARLSTQPRTFQMAVSRAKFVQPTQNVVPNALAQAKFASTVL